MEIEFKKLKAQDIISFGTIILSIHYFISHRLLSGFLNLWGLDSYSILTLEDLTFPLIQINTGIFSILLLSWLGFFLTFITESKNSKSLKEYVKIYRETEDKENYQTIILISTILLSTAVIYFFLFRTEDLYPIDSLEIWYLMMLLLLPIVYRFVNRDYKGWGILVQILSVVTFADSFVSSLLTKIENEPIEYTNKTSINFDHKNEKITTSNNLHLLYHGYKFLILKNKKGDTYLYNIDEISRLKITTNAKH